MDSPATLAVEMKCYFFEGWTKNMNIVTGSSTVISLPELPSGMIELKLVWRPPGNVMMGSPPDEPDRIAEEEQQFQATISHGFWLGRCLVTQAQWQAVKGSNPSQFQDQGEDCPVENVSWHDATAFCQQLNRLLISQLPPHHRFQLPTEVQWEYACREGTLTIYHTGNSVDDLLQAAWHKENSNGRTHRVGEKNPNAWRLYDMHGNVAEWCHDPTSVYPDGPATDWVGYGSGAVRSMRSASYRTPSDSGSFHCAGRGYADPDTRRPWIGFRLCLCHSDQA